MFMSHQVEAKEIWGWMRDHHTTPMEIISFEASYGRKAGDKHDQILCVKRP